MKTLNYSIRLLLCIPIIIFAKIEIIPSDIKIDSNSNIFKASILPMDNNIPCFYRLYSIESEEGFSTNNIKVFIMSPYSDGFKEITKNYPIQFLSGNEKSSIDIYIKVEVDKYSKSGKYFFTLFPEGNFPHIPVEFYIKNDRVNKAIETDQDLSSIKKIYLFKKYEEFKFNLNSNLKLQINGFEIKDNGIYQYNNSINMSSIGFSKNDNEYRLKIVDNSINYFMLSILDNESGDVIKESIFLRKNTEVNQLTLIDRKVISRPDQKNRDLILSLKVKNYSTLPVIANFAVKFQSQKTGKIYKYISLYPSNIVILPNGERNLTVKWESAINHMGEKLNVIFESKVERYKNTKTMSLII